MKCTKKIKQRKIVIIMMHSRNMNVFIKSHTRLEHSPKKGKDSLETRAVFS